MEVNGVLANRTVACATLMLIRGARGHPDQQLAIYSMDDVNCPYHGQTCP
jgi:hypothetical protein